MVEFWLFGGIFTKWVPVTECVSSAWDFLKNNLCMIKFVSNQVCEYSKVVQGGKSVYTRRQVQFWNVSQFFSPLFWHFHGIQNRIQLLNLLDHAKEFRVTAEWHFFANSHGERTSEGLNGTTKRLTVLVIFHSIQ